eukprot:g6553.t1
MLTKFESKSNRVKGLSFHPIRPWILTSLHNGIIQLWDYRMGTLLDRFDEHDGPVRGVDFHKTQPLIVSGGDDYKIKVWDYKLRRCLFTLLGHLDYIRTVQFHNEYPWIISASDDQTIRIWNWQSRTCIAVLTGHNHYVMCAAFHPKDDLVVSASLDQTVRVWDTTGLRKKTVRGAPSAMQHDDMVSRVNTDLFGGTDAVVKYVLEGHDRGVNWASFHPTLPLVISGADDRQVKLWRMNETKAWEVHTMTGHTNNVSCVIFHPKRELIVSNSEDRSIRVWDISQRMGVQTFRRENDRFWILAAHPEQNLLAAGHDSGMIVFKLERERPAYDTHGSRLLYVRDRYLRVHELQTGRDHPLVSMRRPGQSQGASLGQGPRSLQHNAFNPAESNVLVTYDSDGGCYELLTFGSMDGGSSGVGADPNEVRRGSCLAAVFLARNRFAVLDKNRQILIKNFSNEVTKKCTPPHPNTDGMHFGGTSGRLLLRCEDRMTLYEQQSRKVLAELQVPRVKYSFWNHDCSLVALASKHTIVIANKQLDQLATVSETVRVKSGAWDTNNRIFVYSTLNHIKYLLPNGDTGIIRTLDVPLYLTKAVGKKLFCLDREGKTRTVDIDNTEALFKLALEDKKYGEVMHMVRHSRLCGQSIISYLQEKGFPEVALHFVSDNKTKFRLALACGNIEVAMHTADKLPDDAIWHQLGTEALRQGNHQISLAYLTAATHGLEEDAGRLRELLEAQGMPIPETRPDAALLQPPTPIVRTDNWPLLAVSRGPMQNSNIEERADDGGDEPTGEEWDVDLDLDDDGGPKDEAGGGGDGGGAGDDGPKGWGDDDDLDLGDDDLDFGDEDGPARAKPIPSDMADFAMPPAGRSLPTLWVENSSHAADHAAAGDFQGAMQLLNRQIAVVNFEPLRAHFLAVHTGTQASLPGLNVMPSLRSCLQRNASEKNPEKNSLPAVALKASVLLDRLKAAYKAFTMGSFAESRQEFDFILRAVPLVVGETRAEGNELKELLSICREYVTAIRIKAAVAETKDTVRNMELLAYFTCCNLQPAHLLLALRMAMASAFKGKNFITAASFAQRLLELPDLSSERHADLRTKATKVLQKSQQMARNEHTLDYDERNPFEVDCQNLKPIYRGSPSCKCPYCGSAYQPFAKGSVCVTCGLSQIGVETLGLVTTSSAGGKR